MDRLLFKARVAIVIKALNEEKHIQRCIESAVAAANAVSGVVILADSGSRDQTTAIASQYPISIVQLSDWSERCCGIGAQLGYQFADADYVYILDGDMELDEGFLPAALQFLNTHPQHAGVAGLVEEHGGGNYEFEVRKAQDDGRQLGLQSALDMGGLYRVAMLREVGHLTNRNLHSYEEKELGFRLSAAGFLLERIAIPAVRHYGKTDNSMTLLWRRWKSRHIDGPGEWIRSLVGTAQFWTVCRMFKQFWLVLFSWLFLLLGVMALGQTALPLSAALLLQLLFLLRFVQKNRSLRFGLIGFVNIHVSAAGMLRGLLRTQRDPGQYIAAVCLKSCSEKMS